jgi:hypothetical protein
MLFNMVVLLAILAVLCTAVVKAADVSGIWSDKDLVRVQQYARSTAQKSTNSRDIYHSFQLLKKFGSLENICQCSTVMAASTPAKSSYDWFWAKANSDECGCSVTVPTHVLDNLEISISVC